MNRRRLILFGAQALPVLAMAAAARGQDAARPRQNIEYRLIEPPQPVTTGDRIEVIDFFWYGCPFCNELLPALEEWIARKPRDVAVRRIPALLRETWLTQARIFYALELLNEVERLHQKVFHSYHVEKLHLWEHDVIEQWAIKNGIDRRRWVDAYFSPEIDARLFRARRATQVYTVEGTPSLAVDGRYITSGSMAPSLKGMLPVLDELIQLARQRRTGK